MSDEPIVPRKLELELANSIPRYWCNDSPFMTHMLNVYTLLVPDNETYYVRQLKYWEDQISDQQLLGELQNFCRQEMQHGIAHKRYWHNMDALNIRYRGFVKLVGWLNYKLLEPVIPRKVHLAIVATIEHINAYLAHYYLSNNVLEHADPDMKTLFNWHFSEEIEHKDVAFDVFQHISGNYFIRIAGALLVLPLFYLINTLGTLYLLAQDGKLFRRKTWADCFHFLFTRGALMHSMKHAFDFFRPGFHPSNINDYHLASSFFAASQPNGLLKEYPQLVD